MREDLDCLAAEDNRRHAVAAVRAITIRSQSFEPAVSMIAR
jgi:hypothetical protein